MNQQTIRRSFNFRFVKIALIVFQILSIIGGVILIALSAAALAIVDQEKPEEREELRTAATVIIVVSAIGLLIDVVGLVGSIREKWILTLVFGVITFASGILNVVYREYWAVGIDWSVAILAFVFVHLLRKLANQSPA